MGAKYWLKMYHEALYDPKLASLADNLWRRFWELCLMAGELDAGGFLPNVDDMAWTIRTDTDTLTSELGQLAARSMVEPRIDDEGEERWFVRNFAKRQAASTTAKRMREYRQRVKKEKEGDTDTDTYRTVTHVTDPLRNVTHNGMEPLRTITENAADAFSEIFGAMPSGGSVWVKKWQPTLDSLAAACDGDLTRIRATLEEAHAVWEQQSKKGKRYPANSPGSVAWAITEVLQKAQASKPAPLSITQRINTAWEQHANDFTSWPADLREAAAAQDWHDYKRAVAMTAWAAQS